MARFCVRRWAGAAVLAGIAVVFGHSPAVAQENDRRLETVRLAGQIAVDGALDEPSWSQAPVARGFKPS